MNNQIWEDIKTPQGSPLVGKMLKEIPKGPYMMIPQELNEVFQRRYYLMDFERTDHFFVRLGFYTYAINDETLEPMMIAYLLDTSD